MSIGLAFWVLMIVWLCFSIWASWPAGGLRAAGGSFLIFVLLALLGWKVFGAAIHN